MVTMCIKIHSKRDRNFTEGDTFELTKYTTNNVFKERKRGVGETAQPLRALAL